MSDLSEFHALTEVDQLRKALQNEQIRTLAAKKKTADLVEAVRDGARDAALAMGPVPPVPKPRRDKRKGEEVALLHVSDWQFGKVTVSFNTDIAGARVERLANKVVRLAEIERADHPVRDCHVMLGGDMVEGVMIFPGQAFEVDGGMFRQLFAASTAVAVLIRTLLANFEHVHVWEEYGNHGRIGKKGDMPREDNVDLLAYEIARERLSEGDRLVWHPSQGWHSIVEIGNYRALLVHGDEIRQYGGNIPAFGITRKVNAWATGVTASFIDAYMGHFHTPMVLPIAHGRGRTFVNGSIESDNVYAAEFVAASGTPGQRLNFIDPERGRVTTERLVWLDD